MGVTLFSFSILALGLGYLYVHHLERVLKQRLYWPRLFVFLLSPLAIFLLLQEKKQYEQPPTPGNVQITYTAWRRQDKSDSDES